MKTIYFITVFVFVSVSCAFSQIATDEMLHNKFNFYANRKIDLNGKVDINDIDRVVQSDKIIFFLMKNDSIFPPEMDNLVKFAGEVFEEHLEIPYSIPICLYWRKNLGVGGQSYNIKVSDILNGIGCGFIDINTVYHSFILPKEGSYGGGSSSGWSVLFHEMTHVLGFDRTNFNNEITANYFRDGIWFFDSPQTRKSNGGYPVQYLETSHFVDPLNYVDYGCNMTQSMGRIYPGNPHEQVYYHLGNALLAVFESIGWTLKQGIDYTCNTYTGVLFDNDDREWASIDDKIYYNGTTHLMMRTPYTFQDWLAGNVPSYEKLIDDWLLLLDTTDWIRWIASLGWDHDYWYSVKTIINQEFHNDGINTPVYKTFIERLTWAITDEFSSSAFRDTAKIILSQRYPNREMLLPLLKDIWNEHVAGWENYVLTTDWIEYEKQRKEKNIPGYEFDWSVIDKFLEGKNQVTYNALIYALSENICYNHYLEDYISITQTYLYKKYPFNELLALLHLTNIKNVVKPQNLIYAVNGDIFIKSEATIESSNIFIYSIDGKMIKHDLLKSSEKRIHVGRGFFIIVVNGESYKVISR